MWGEFHAIRSSDDFTKSWSSFLAHTKCGTESPILFQYITDKFFRKMLSCYFPLRQTSVASRSESLPLTYEEKNGLRYAAGYVCRTVSKKIKTEEMMLSLEELLEDEDGIGDDKDESSNWTNLVDRGGLLHITDDAFHVFASAEEVVRKFYCREKAKELSCGKNEEIVEQVIRDEQVMFYWSVVANDMDEKIGEVLLRMIVVEWVKIRGFSFAGAWLELYKQRSKKTLQRSKGLRKVLNTSEIK